MHVRMRIQMSGTRDGVDWPPRGEVIEVDDKEGAELCKAGLAEPVATPPAVERAIQPEPERRVTPKR